MNIKTELNMNKDMGIETDIDVDMNTAMNHGKTDRRHGHEHCNLRENTCCSRIRLLWKYETQVVHTYVNRKEHMELGMVYFARRMRAA